MIGGYQPIFIATLIPQLRGFFYCRIHVQCFETLYSAQYSISMLFITHFKDLHRNCEVIVTLEKILDGSTSKVHTQEIIKNKNNGEQTTVVEWYDENDQKIQESNYLQVLESPEIGREIGSLLLETRYKIIDIQH